MRRIILTLALILSLDAGMCRGQEFITHRGVVPDGYNFWVYLPDDYNPLAADMPVVIFLHGRSLCGHDLNQVMRYGTLDALKKGRKINAVVIAPQNPGESWKPDKIIRVLDWCLEHYPADGDRVYALGMSLGGFGTMDLAGAYPDRIAAGVALCGGCYLKDLHGLGQVPMWIMHGTADEKVGVNESRKVVEKLIADGDDGHVMYDWLKGYNHGKLARCFYMPMIYDWLFDHNLRDQERQVNWTYTISDADFDNAYRNFDYPGGRNIPVSNYK